MRPRKKASYLALIVITGFSTCSGIAPEPVPVIPQNLGWYALSRESPRALWSAYEQETDPARKRILDEAYEVSFTRCTHFEVDPDGTKCDE